jgi:hypothetical protein
VIVCAAVVLSALGACAEPARAETVSVRTPAGWVSATSQDKIEVMFNPKEYTISKATPWKHHDVQGLDAPTLEFTSGESYRLQMDLTLPAGSIKQVMALAQRSADTGLTPPVQVRWGGKLWLSRLLRAEVVPVNPGPPRMAVLRTLWSDFSPAVEGGHRPPRGLPMLIGFGGEVVAATLDPDETRLYDMTAKDGFVTVRDFAPAEQGMLDHLIDLRFGDPLRLVTSQVIDESARGDDVSALVARMLKAMGPVDARGARVPILVRIDEGRTFHAMLANFSLRFTLFGDDGTPVRAVMNTAWKEFSPAEEQLKGNPRH